MGRSVAFMQVVDHSRMGAGMMSVDLSHVWAFLSGQELSPEIVAAIRAEAQDPTSEVAILFRSLDSFATDAEKLDWLQFDREERTARDILAAAQFFDSKAEVMQRVLDAASRNTARRQEHVMGASQLGRDLGFDSLTLINFFFDLEGALGLRDIDTAFVESMLVDQNWASASLEDIADLCWQKFETVRHPEEANDDVPSSPEHGAVDARKAPARHNDTQR